MIDRAEKTGFGIALVGHAALLAALTVGLASLGRAPSLSDPIEISFVEEVGLVSASPEPAAAPPEAGMAPALGPIEDAAPSAPADPAPVPPPPRAAPAERSPPAPAPKQSRRTRSSDRAATGEQARRPRLADVLKGIGRDTSPSRSRNSPAATMSARAAADIGSAIERQVQPCADRQVYPGPGAERIVTTLNLRLERDGSLARPPRVVDQGGIDDENRRYAQRVADLAIRSFVECSPLRGLPAELYDVPRGWSNFTMRYRLPG